MAGNFSSIFHFLFSAYHYIITIAREECNPEKKVDILICDGEMLYLFWFQQPCKKEGAKQFVMK